MVVGMVTALDKHCSVLLKKKESPRKINWGGNFRLLKQVEPTSSY